NDGRLTAPVARGPLHERTMPIVSCPNCTQQMSLADNSAGKQFRCPRCQNIFTAPPAAPAPAPAAAAPAPAPARAAAGAAVATREGAVNLCPNPACGVANPPGERYCQRCSTVLPTSPGTVLHGRYKIKRHLAEGGFGSVYLAEDTKSQNRQVVIKDMICKD